MNKDLMLQNYTQERKALKPLYTADKWETKTGFIKWFAETLPKLEDIHEPRICFQQNNLIWYLGEYDLNREYRLVAGQEPIRNNNYTATVMVNHIYNLTEQSISRESLAKPTFEVLPSNDESGDRVSARNMKVVLDSIGRKNNADLHFINKSRHTKVFGESFTVVDFDPDMFDEAGDLSGDVTFRLKEPFWVLYEPVLDWDKDCRYIISIEKILHVDEAKKIYKNNKIESDKTQTIFGFQTDDVQYKNEEEVIVYRFIHKPTKEIPNGVDALIVGDQVVRFNTKKYPYSHKKLPYIRRTDIDVPGSFIPLSVYKWAIPVQHHYNKMVSLEHKYISLAAHPKWMMQKGACDIKSLGNAATVVQVKPGAPFPQLLITNPVAQDIIEAKNTMKQELQIMFGIQGVSMGTPPAGARAASMLNFYEEQEAQRASTQLIKHNESIREVFSMAASLAAEFYPANPERLAKLVGKNNKFGLLEFTEADAGTEYDILVQNSTGFSDSVQARIEEIDKLNQMYPGILSPQQAMNVLQYRIPEKFYDVATAALKSAEAENEDFLSGYPVTAPAPYEDLIIHLEQHYLLMQNPNFKLMADAFRMAAIDHIGKTEMLLDEALNKPTENAAVLREIVSKKFPYYPVIFGGRPQLPEAPQAAMPGDPNAPMPEGGMPPIMPPMAPQQAFPTAAELAPLIESPRKIKISEFIRDPSTGLVKTVIAREIPESPSPETMAPPQEGMVPQGGEAMESRMPNMPGPDGIPLLLPEEDEGVPLGG